ncbi:hypothetical protein D3C71_1953200 [compost metagenome]
MARELLQQRVGTRAGQARVQHFNDHVNVLDALGNRLACEIHVTGKPLNGHKTNFLILIHENRSPLAKGMHSAGFRPFGKLKVSRTILIL